MRNVLNLSQTNSYPEPSYNLVFCRDWGRKDSDDWGKGWGDEGGWSGDTSPAKSPNKEVEK